MSDALADFLEVLDAGPSRTTVWRREKKQRLNIDGNGHVAEIAVVEEDDSDHNNQGILCIRCVVISR